jgi:AcrR family transcriptional regulator
MSLPVTSPGEEDLAQRRGYHHGNLREALLEAARRLTAERGPHGFTMAEAARLAGVSASAPYRHFKDRDALLGELARRGFALFAARLGAASAGAEGFTGMGHAYLAFAREEPGHYRAMFGWRDPSAAPEDAALGAGSAFAALVESLARRLPEGRGRDSARLLGLQVWALSHGLAELERAGMPPPGSGAPPPEAVLAAAVERLVRGG